MPATAASRKNAASMRLPMRRPYRSGNAHTTVSIRPDETRSRSSSTSNATSGRPRRTSLAVPIARWVRWHDHSGMDLDRIVAIFRALRDQRVEYILVGGTAMNLHGFVRATEDVDLFLKIDADNVARLRAALKDVWSDPDIEEITFDDLAGDYPVVRYGPPGEDFVIDIMSR